MYRPRRFYLPFLYLAVVIAPLAFLGVAFFQPFVDQQLRAFGLDGYFSWLPKDEAIIRSFKENRAKYDFLAAHYYYEDFYQLFDYQQDTFGWWKTTPSGDRIPVEPSKSPEVQAQFEAAKAELGLFEVSRNEFLFYDKETPLLRAWRQFSVIKHDRHFPDEACRLVEFRYPLDYFEDDAQLTRERFSVAWTGDHGMTVKRLRYFSTPPSFRGGRINWTCSGNGERDYALDFDEDLDPNETCTYQPLDPNWFIATCRIRDNVPPEPWRAEPGVMTWSP